MNNKQNEVSHYPEIQKFIEAQIKSNFMAAKQDAPEVFWGIGELKENLRKMIFAHPEKCGCANSFLQKVPPLNLDIFALITNGRCFELLILEVKLLKGAGLKELSQLIGYCLVSGAKYGILLNIDNGASPRLSEILNSEGHVSHIYVKRESKTQEHCLGFMQWDSMTKSFEYSNLGTIKSLSDLSKRLLVDFSCRTQDISM